MSFHPYLNFGGNCREAFTRYQEIFGGELSIMTMADIPTDDMTPGEDAPWADQPDLVAHAALTVGGHLLMASDDPGDFGGVTGMWVNYTTDDVDEAKRIFEALADGGSVAMPAGETFWSPFFGMCVDRFGTQWMVNLDPGEPAG